MSSCHPITVEGGSIFRGLALAYHWALSCCPVFCCSEWVEEEAGASGLTYTVCTSPISLRIVLGFLPLFISPYFTWNFPDSFSLL